MMYESSEEMLKDSLKNPAVDVRLATVRSLTANGRAKVTFFGDAAESQKIYSHIAGYIPCVGDKVMLLRQGNTFVIMGAVAVDEIVVTYALKEHKHDNVYANKTHSHEEYAEKQHNHDDKYPEKSHTHSNLKNGTKELTIGSSGEFLPDETNKQDIGSSNLKFKTVYTGSVVCGSTTYDENTASCVYDEFYKTGTTYAKELRRIRLYSSELLPGGTESISIGSTSKRFKDFYTKTVHTDSVNAGSVVLGNTTYDENTASSLFDEYYKASVESTKKNRSVRFYNGTIAPVGSAASVSIGSSSNPFDKGYFKTLYQNGTAVSTSDRRKKSRIKDLSSKYVELFKLLRPVTFKYKKRKRLHTGFIAQEVEEAMNTVGISSEEFSGLVIDENGEYGLRYEDFIAIQTKVIQELQKKVESMERKVIEIESRI